MTRITCLLCKIKRKLRLLASSLESSLELVKTSASINKLLLTGEEGVALGANFNSDFATLGGLGSNYLAASATDYTLFVIRMNSRLHNIFTSFLLFDVL